jgi:hypothetical protein
LGTGFVEWDFTQSQAHPAFFPARAILASFQTNSNPIPAEFYT